MRWVTKVLETSKGTCVTDSQRSTFLRRVGELNLLSDPDEKAVKNRMANLIRNMGGGYSKGDVDKFLVDCGLVEPLREKEVEVLMRLAVEDPHPESGGVAEAVCAFVEGKMVSAPGRIVKVKKVTRVTSTVRKAV